MTLSLSGPPELCDCMQWTWISAYEKRWPRWRTVHQLSVNVERNPVCETSLPSSRGLYRPLSELPTRGCHIHRSADYYDCKRFQSKLRIPVAVRLSRELSSNVGANNSLFLHAISETSVTFTEITAAFVVPTNWLNLFRSVYERVVTVFITLLWNAATRHVRRTSLLSDNWGSHKMASR